MDKQILSLQEKRKKREDAVLEMLEHTDQIVRYEVQEMLGISQAAAILLLRDMTEQGLLIKEGKGRFLHYCSGAKK